MNWLYHCCICNITFHLKISWLKLPRSSLCDNHCTIFFTIWSEFIVQKISTYHIAVSIHNFTCDIYDFIKDTYSTLDFIWNRVKKVHFSRSSRTFGEDSRSDKIYSSGNRGVKKGPGPRGTRDEEFLVPSLHHCVLTFRASKNVISFFFLDPTNPICYSRKAFAASDRPTLPQHWFSQHFFADISCFYWWYYSSWSFKESVFPTWATRLTYKFKWVRIYKYTLLLG